MAALRPGERECVESVIANNSEALRRLFARLRERADLRACYEAGPQATNLAPAQWIAASPAR